jgi:mRNA-degrading endonuclease RelE of RelBE toxin-antitoxin system
VRLIIHKRAIKSIARMSDKDRAQIMKGIYGLKEEPPIGDIVKMQGQNGFRLRVRGHRVMFDRTDGLLEVTGVEPRGQAYGKRTRR